MTTIDIIRSLCWKYQRMRQLMQQDKDLRRGQLILALKGQIWRLKREYKEAHEQRRAKAMLYQHDGRFFLADKEITMYEYREAQRLRSLKIS